MSLGDYANKLIGGHCFMKGLPSGERRRVSIARELVMRPHVLFIDEPLYHLDRFVLSYEINHCGHESFIIQLYNYIYQILNHSIHHNCIMCINICNLCRNHYLLVNYLYKANDYYLCRNVPINMILDFCQVCLLRSILDHLGFYSKQ